MPKRPPIIAIRIDEESFKRWNALDTQLPHGYKTQQARIYLLGLIRDLEKDAGLGIDREAKGEGPASGSGGGAEECKACDSRRGPRCGRSETDATVCAPKAGREGECGNDPGEHPESFLYEKRGCVHPECGSDPAPEQRPEEAW